MKIDRPANAVVTRIITKSGRSKVDIDRDWLQEQYVVQQRTHQSIADELCIGVMTVWSRCKEFGFGRSRSEVKMGEANPNYGNTGEKNPNHGEGSHLWKGDDAGVYAKIQFRPDGVILREEVYARDGGVCVDCGAKVRDKSGRALSLHHLIDVKDRPDLILDPSNCVTICTGCHMKRHRAEERRQRELA